MEFNSIDHHFCEGNILGVPEVLNSFTSLIFSFFGIYGLCSNYFININYIHDTNIFITNFIYSIFFVIGIGSFGYHWTQHLGWALMDETPMIISLFVGLLYIEYTNTLLNKFNKNNIITHHNNYLYNLSYKISSFFFTYIMFCFITINPFSYYRKLFPFFWASCLIIFSFRFLNLVSSFDNIFNKDIRHYVKHQVLITYISGIVWCFTEIICNYSHNLLLLFGHPLWHFTIGYSFYNIIQIIYFINLYSKIKYINNDILNVNISYNKFYLLYIKNDFILPK